jgi:hypothetical protein
LGSLPVVATCAAMLAARVAQLSTKELWVI